MRYCLADETVELYANCHELTGREAEQEASDRDFDAAEELAYDCEDQE